MPRDFLPAVYPSDGVEESQTSYLHDNLFNCVPHLLSNGEIGASPRPSFLALGSAPANSADRGRGMVSFGGEYDLYLDQDTYYYDGGNQDLTATTGQGYAGNTGFNEEYIASFARHKVSGVENLVIANAGHTSTHASANHGNLWYQSAPSAAPNSVSDADMPGNNGVSITRGGASLDGYFFLCDINGQIHNSDLNDITAWTATNFLTAEREPDIGVYCGKHHDHVVYIGTRSIEFFYNAGNPTGSPLARRQDVAYSIGCYYPNSIVEVGDVIYFVGTDNAGWSRVYKLQQFSLTVISSPKIEESLRRMTGTFPDITDLDALMHSVWMTYATIADGPGLILTGDNVTASTFQFTSYWSETYNKWCPWTFEATPTYVGGIVSSSGWTECLPVVGYNGTAWGVGSSQFSRYQFTNGALAYEDLPRDSAINDANQSNAPDVFILFPRWDGGTTHRKRIKWARLIYETRADSLNATFDNIDVDLRWFDYDATASLPQAPHDFSTGRSVDITVNNGPRWSRLGTVRERQFLVEYTAAAGRVNTIKGLEIKYEVMPN